MDGQGHGTTTLRGNETGKGVEPFEAVRSGLFWFVWDPRIVKLKEASDMRLIQHANFEDSISNGLLPKRNSC